jgi:hypothetical protein
MRSLGGELMWPSSNDLLRLGHAYVKFGGDFWRMWSDASARYAWRAAAEAFAIGLGPKTPEHIPETLLLGLRNYAAEMAVAFPAAVDGLSRSLDLLASGEVSPPSPKTFLIRAVPLMAPVRIADASQGWAIYFVAAAQVQDHLAKQGQPFTAVDVGNGRTPVIVFGTEYRDCDLGACQEIAVALFVTPNVDRREPPGLLFISLTVSDEYGIEPGKVLWGFHKTMAKDLVGSRSAETARFAIDRNDPTALSVSFPRFGRARSSNVPYYAYGTSTDLAGNETTRKTPISRSAIGEGVQIGGAVELRLGDGTQPRCVCRLGPGSTQACVCLMLRALGLPRRPAANGWAEHISAVVPQSSACGAPMKAAGQRGSGIAIERISDGVVTESMVIAAAQAGKRLVLAKGIALTPLAEDKARELGLEIERES